MQFNIEKLSNLERRLSVAIPAETIDNEVLKRLKELAPKVNIPGFRRGKIPFAMIQKQYGDAVRAETVEKMISSTYAENLRKENLTPAGPPHLDSISTKPHEPLSYSISFEIYPEIKITDLDQIKLEKITATIAEQDIDKFLEHLRTSHSNWKEATDTQHAAQKGERLVVDYELMVENETRETKQDYQFELGAGRNLADFEQPLYDGKIGDELHFTLKFPGQYEKSCAGREGNFKVTIKKILQAAPPTLDDAFAEKLGISGGLNALRAEVKKTLEAEINRLSASRLRTELMDALLAKHPFDVPKCLVAAEIRASHEHEQKAPTAITPEQQQTQENTTKRQVAGGMLLAAIAKEQGLQVKPEQLRDKVTEMTKLLDGNMDLLNKLYRDNPQLLRQLESHLLEDQIFEYLEKTIGLTEKPLSYPEALKLLGEKHGQ